MAPDVNALQNHPGDIEYPVRSRRRYTQALDAKRKTDPAEMRRRALPVTLIAARGWNGSLAFTPTYAELPQELQRFAEVVHSDGGEHMMTRVAGLTELPVFDIQDLARGTQENPARLLLAADIERGIGGIRYAYVAGYLTADETWALLEPLAEKAFATYRSADEYWREVIIATAFRTDSLQAVQSQRDALADPRRSSWPAASVPWPAWGARA